MTMRFEERGHKDVFSRYGEEGGGRRRKEGEEGGGPRRTTTKWPLPVITDDDMRFGEEREAIRTHLAGMEGGWSKKKEERARRGREKV
jgi:hypothetical protein